MPFKSVLAMMFGVGLFFLCQTAKPESDPQELPPQQQLERIKQEFQTGFDQLQREYRQAETRELRQGIEGKYQQFQRGVVAEFLELAAANRESELVEQAFSWMFRVILDDKARQLAKDRWLEVHINDAGLAPTLVFLGMADERDFLRKVIKRATNKTVLGSACFNLAMSLRRSEALTKDGEAEAISLLERIETEFANIIFMVPDGPPGGRLGDLAAAPLFEFKYLSVGKIAPEIEGEDIDGVTFRLSDYRGKVVLLSFWGHW